MAEQAAFNSIRAGHHRQFRCGHGGAAVVVRVQADRRELTTGQVPREPLDLVGVHVGRGHLDGRRQVEDDLSAGLGLPDIGHRFADVDGELEFGAGEDLRGVLVAELGAAQHFVGVLHHDLGATSRDRSTLVLVHSENHPPEHRGGRVVHVDVGPIGPHQRLDGARNQILAGLGQDRDLYVVGDHVALDELAHEVEVGLARAREADLDLLVAHPDQEFEHLHLAGGRHRVDQRLVAVAEIR